MTDNPQPRGFRPRLTRLPDPFEFERELREAAEAERDDAISQRDAERAARLAAEERIRQLEAELRRRQSES